uniref:Uncharacterized protein n=1 Tax=Panagrolaimus davidi TaxID=227884 RepID=A0A914QSY8_9BILA
MDICEHSVKIPLQNKYWNKWTNNNLLKVLEVYNLVSDGFIVGEREYQFFIDFIKTNFNTANFSKIHLHFLSFQEYFCTSIYGGKFYPWIIQTNTTKEQIQNRSQCHFLTLDFRRTRLIQKVNQTLKEDFGEFWNQNMTQSLIGMSKFEDKGKPQISFMKKIISINQKSGENNYKNGLSRQRNVEEKTYSEFSSTTKTAFAPPVSAKTVQVTLNVNCEQNIVTINGKTDSENVVIYPTPIIPQSSTAINLPSPSNPKPSTETLNIEKSYVLAQNAPSVPLTPSNPEIKNIAHAKLVWNSWNSGTPNPDVRYYTKDEIPRVLATDY